MKCGRTKVHCQGISGNSVVNGIILVFFMWPIFQQLFGQTGLNEALPGPHNSYHSGRSFWRWPADHFSRIDDSDSYRMPCIVCTFNFMLLYCSIFLGVQNFCLKITYLKAKFYMFCITILRNFLFESVRYLFYVVPSVPFCLSSACDLRCFYIKGR